MAMLIPPPIPAHGERLVAGLDGHMGGRQRNVAHQVHGGRRTGVEVRTDARVGLRPELDVRLRGRRTAPGGRVAGAIGTAGGVVQGIEKVSHGNRCAFHEIDGSEIRHGREEPSRVVPRVEKIGAYGPEAEPADKRVWAKAVVALGACE